MTVIFHSHQQGFPCCWLREIKDREKKEGMMKRKQAWMRFQAEHVGREYEDRISGHHSHYNAFDLNDVPNQHVQLASLSGDMLEDVKKLVIYADEKRRTAEDYRAWRRNRNDWIMLVVSVCICVMIPLTVPTLVAWAISGLPLIPQSFLLLYKTVKKY